MHRASTVIGFAALAWLAATAPARDSGSWVGTWGTSPVGLPAAAKVGSHGVPLPTNVKGSIRYRLRIAVGGSRIRLRLSNEYGAAELAVAAVSVGIAGERLDVLPGSLRRATFAGKTAVTIPAGAPMLSDPIDLPVKPLSDLMVTLYVPAGVALFSWSPEAGSTTDPAVVDALDATLSEHLPDDRRMSIRPLVAAVDVLTDHPRKVIAAFGDSITDGMVDPATGERGWPGALSRRLAGRDISVVNAGIGGNRLLQSLSFMGSSALSRMDRDVFSIPGLSHVVLLEGINDIGMSGKGGMFGDLPPVTPQDLIGAYGQIIERAHERGIKVFGATILPFEGAGYYSAEKEQVRQTVNAWIRASKAFDGFIDFDAVMRDPASPRTMKAAFDSGDHLHPNAAGYRHMGDVIELRLFD